MKRHSFYLELTSIKTNDDVELSVAAQYHDNGDGSVDRLIVLNDYAIRDVDIDAVIAAMTAARDAVQAVA